MQVGIPFEYLIDVLTVLIGIGLLLILRPILVAIVNAIVTIVNAYFQKWISIGRVWIRSKVKTRGYDYTQVKRKDIFYLVLEDWRLWLVFSIAAGLIFWDPVRSFAAAAVTGVLGFIFIYMRRGARNVQINTDVENMIVQFASRYPVSRSITKTLEDLLETIEPGDVHFALEQTITRIRIGSSLDVAVQPLIAVPNPSARQFAMTIAGAQQTSPLILDGIFVSLKNDVRARAELMGEVRQSLTVLKITTRVMQAAFCVVLLVVCLKDQWHGYFIESLNHYVTFWGSILAVMAASAYVELEIENRQEA
jgi:hypothetical protein